MKKRNVTDNSRLPCIVLIRPMDMSDPCLITDGENYLFRDVLDNLIEMGLASHVVISSPDYIPEEIREILIKWNIEIDFNKSDLPQKRLMDIFAGKSYKGAIILTSYSYFIDKNALLESCSSIIEGSADFVYTKNVIASKFFMVLNEKSANKISTIGEYPVPPFSFHTKLLQKHYDIHIKKTENIEDIGERFLWELFFAGERAIVPPRLLRKFFSENSPEKWFSRDTFRTFLKNILQIKDWSWLKRHLEDIDKIQPIRRLAMQINYIRRIEELIPKNKKRFLELGSGKTPLTSALLINLFEHGIAIEPYKYSKSGIEETLSLCELLSNNIPDIMPIITKKSKDIANFNNIIFTDNKLEELNLPDNHIDFCISRVVFEHVDDVESLSKELYRVMKPKGVMLHEIGFQDHEDLSCINFDFLRYSKEEWKALNKSTNLWRINDFIEFWERIGFKTQIISRENRNVAPDKIHESWNGYSDEDLFCHMALIKAVKV